MNFASSFDSANQNLTTVVPVSQHEERFSSDWSTSIVTPPASVENGYTDLPGVTSHQSLQQADPRPIRDAGSIPNDCQPQIMLPPLKSLMTQPLAVIPVSSMKRSGMHPMTFYSLAGTMQRDHIQPQHCEFVIPTEIGDFFVTRCQNWPYCTENFSALLQSSANCRSFLYDCHTGVNSVSKSLLDDVKKQDGKIIAPRGTVLSGPAFKASMIRYEEKSPNVLSHELTPMLAPSIERMMADGMITMLFAEEQSREWEDAPQLIRGFPKPIPRSTVGFMPTSFSEQQQDKLEYHLGALGRPIRSLRLPFFAVEMVGSHEPLELANKRNAYNMTIAAQAYAALFQAAHQRKARHRQLVGISVSHNHTTVHIFGHIVCFENCFPNVEVHRTKLQAYDLTESDGYWRWHTRRFVENVYEKLGTMLWDAVKGALDSLPDPPQLVTPLAPAQMTWPSPPPSYLERGRL